MEVNFKSRPLISETDDAVESVRYIEEMSGMKINGIINNTNLGAETTAKTVEEGYKACLELSQQVDIPLLASTVFSSVKDVTVPDVLSMENATKQLF